MPPTSHHVQQMNQLPINNLPPLNNSQFMTSCQPMNYLQQPGVGPYHSAQQPQQPNYVPAATPLPTQCMAFNSGVMLYNPSYPY
eukprot:4853253-Pleurochrysis_carterae.AAC.1